MIEESELKKDNQDIQGENDEFERMLAQAVKTGMVDFETGLPEQADGPADKPAPQKGEENREPENPQAIIDAIAEAVAMKLGVKPAANPEPPEDDLETLLKRQEELKEKVKKAAGDDEAISGLVEMMGELQKRILEKEVKERRESEAKRRLEADMARLREDIAEVEAEYGVKLPPIESEEFKVLMQTAMNIRLNPLKEAYKIVYGKKKGTYTAIDSARKPANPSDRAEYEAQVAALARRVGLNPKDVLNLL